MAAGWKSGDLHRPECLSQPAWGLRVIWLALGLLAWQLVSDLLGTCWLPQASILGHPLLPLILTSLGGAFLGYLIFRRFPPLLQDGAARQWSVTQDRVEEHLRDCEERYRRLVELSPDAIVLHQDLRFVFLNPAAVELFGGRGAQDLLGREILTVVAPESRELVSRRVRQVLTEGSVDRAEIKLLRLDGQQVEAETAAVRLPFQGRPALLVIIRQITERRRVEQELREGEARFRAIFENAPVGIGLMELDGQGLEANPAFIRMLGYPQAEVCRQTTQDLLHPDDVAERQRLIQEIREGRRDSYEREARYLRPDGSHLWARICVSLVPAAGERRPLLVAMLEDITRQKETEAALKAYQERLRSLAAELALTEERERRLLAADLHDHVGQPLALAKIKLAALRETLAWEGRRAEVEEPLRFLEEAIAASRALTSKLSPPLLFEGRLEEALAWLAEQVQQRHHLRVTVHCRQVPAELPEAHRIILFRAVQEALTNVVKHARARNVQISLDRQGPNLCIKVEDDGIGFNVDTVTGKSGQYGGFGLFSIRERLGHMGASLEIASQPGQGTTICIFAPLKDEGLSKEGNHED